MVLDLFENRELYLNMNSGFRSAFDFIEFCKKESPLPGRYDINKDKVFAIVQEYTTVPGNEIQWEAHRKYIDIQYIFEGSELIHCTNIREMPSDTIYNEEKDCLLYDFNGGIQLKMDTGNFAIFYPHDMHKPMCMIDSPSKVKKIIIKVAV
jgi:YhcH/YjgK/YiaL family protein